MPTQAQLKADIAEYIELMGGYGVVTNTVQILYSCMELSEPFKGVFTSWKCKRCGEPIIEPEHRKGK